MNINTTKIWAMLVTTTIMPSLYLIGYFYREGYLGEFGLGSDFFPLSLSEYLTHAFYTFLMIFSQLFQKINNNLHLIFYISTILSILSLAIILIEPYKEKIIAQTTKITKSRIFELIIIPISVGLFSVTIIYLLILAIALLFIFPGMGLFSGAKDAQARIQNFSGCEDLQLLPSNIRCVEIIDDQNHWTGMLIARSDTHIALWTGEHAEFIETAGRQIIVRKGLAAENQDETDSSQ